MYKPFIEDEEGGHCLECGEPLYGRSDKKFCDSNCRNAWHGHIRSESRRRHHLTLQGLNSNYAILSNMLRIHKSSCPVSSLISMGFRPEYVTHRGEKIGRHLEYRCFDIAYCLTPKKLFNLHKI